MNLPKVGDVIDGVFEVISEIGRGGMGGVLRVREKKSKREFALKYCLHADIETRRRFAREVRLMKKIVHTNVIPIKLDRLDHDPPYFIMPLAKNSIAEELTHFRTDLGLALDAFKQIVAGVRAIHGAGVAHRDIKPVNALRLADGTVVVSDLGLARLDERDTTILTKVDRGLGTAMYCAPEQFCPGGSRDADARTDVYQLGKTLYELVTGDPPTPVDPKRIPDGIRHIIQKATRDLPDKRYQTADAMLDALHLYERSQGVRGNPARFFDALFQRMTDRLASKEQFVDEDLTEFCAAFTDEQVAVDGVLVHAFGKLPKELIPVLAERHHDHFCAVVERYAAALDQSIGGEVFSFAETVAKRMRLLFDSASSPELKSLALRCCLIAAVDLNRFAAMESFDSMLCLVTNDDVAMAVAEMLREESVRYAQVAERIPVSGLHPAIQAVRTEVRTPRSSEAPESSSFAF